MPAENVHIIASGGTGGRGGSAGGPGGQGGQGGTGQGPTFIINGSVVTFGFVIQAIKEKLAGHVAAQHKFTDQSKSLCAPGTRAEIQADILKWLSPQTGTKERIFWITGIAGSGKSTLSATVVENLRKNKKHTPVAAQFFISRNIPETIDPAKIIPTIALQLAEFSPVAAGIICDVLERGFPATRKNQVEELLLAPIQELSKSGNAVIILIDALDELKNAADSVKKILESMAPRGCDLPNNVRFLITSRPEHWADISRSKTLELAVFKQHPLMTDSSVSEVHNFIIARMKQITRWNDWPSDNEMQKLSDKANGLFHYAATALHWIEEQIRKRGTASRKQVFEQFTEMGIGQLEDLYRLILTSFENIDSQAQDADWRASQLRGFQHVIGTILVLDEPLTIRQITALLADISEDDFDVQIFLEQFRSVLIPGMTISFLDAMPQMHKSFRDYIMGVHAPAEFRILMNDAHFVTARSCLEVILKARSQSNVVVNYSVGHWYKHLRKVVEAGTTWEDERMWDLFGQMLEEAVVGSWAATDMMDVFVDVATVGWMLLKQNIGTDKVQRISRILVKAKEFGEEERFRRRERERRRRLQQEELEEEGQQFFFEEEGGGRRFEEERRRKEEEEFQRVHAFPPLPMFVFLTFSCPLVSSNDKSVLSPLPMFVLLTFSCLLVSSKTENKKDDNNDERNNSRQNNDDEELYNPPFLLLSLTSPFPLAALSKDLG